MRLAAALTLLVCALAAGCATGQAPTQPLVLVSGLDDHGLLEVARVPLHAAPGGAVSAEVAAGTLARALEVRGAWTRVVALESAGPGHDHDAAEGWVGDYHLRGTLHVLAEPAHCQVPAYADAAGAPAEPLPASTQVTPTDVRHAPDGSLRVQVATVIQPQRTAWVDRAALSEVSAAASARRANGHHLDR
jgi:hypothetical protein